MVEPTHLKNLLITMSIFPKFRGEHIENIWNHHPPDHYNPQSTLLNIYKGPSCKRWTAPTIIGASNWMENRRLSSLIVGHELSSSSTLKSQWNTCWMESPHTILIYIPETPHGSSEVRQKPRACNKNQLRTYIQKTKQFHGKNQGLLLKQMANS